MSKAITVQQLKEYCEEQIKKGNGDRVIMISNDEEGNGYHYLWYAFTEPEEVLLEDEAINENVAKYEDTIILG